MHCPTPSRTLLSLALAVALSTTSINADYKQTLAAKGADAFAAPEATADIDQNAVAETFASNIIEASPALSDQEVMIDLQARMLSEQRLEEAAAALDPTAVSAVVGTNEAQTNALESETLRTETQDPKTTDQSTAAVASR